MNAQWARAPRQPATDNQPKSNQQNGKGYNNKNPNNKQPFRNDQQPLRERFDNKNQGRNENAINNKMEGSAPLGNWDSVKLNHPNNQVPKMPLSNLAARVMHKPEGQLRAGSVKSKVEQPTSSQNIGKKYQPKPFICNFCGKEAESQCGRCGDYYCSQACQASDWLEHKPYCHPMP